MVLLLAFALYFFGAAFLAIFLFESLTLVVFDAPGLVAGVAFLSALPFDLVNPARRPQVGQAPGPWPASTRRAIAICSALVAWWAGLASFLPPYAFHVPAANCTPP